MAPKLRGMKLNYNFTSSFIEFATAKLLRATTCRSSLLSSPLRSITSLSRFA